MINKWIQSLRITLFRWILFPIVQALFNSCCYTFFINKKECSIDDFKNHFNSSPLILATWHQNLLLIPHLIKHHIHCPLTAVISKSRDGQILSSLQSSLKIRIIEVAHDNRQAALIQIINELKEGSLIAITPDGPRGPWKKVKPGLTLAAKKAKSPVMCLSYEVSNFWTLPTPDKMKLPKLRASIQVNLNIVKEIPKERKEACLSIEQALN